MDLTNVSTKELVEELSKREAVERVEVENQGELEIAVLNDQRRITHYSIHPGPQIILRIWD